MDTRFAPEFSRRQLLGLGAVGLVACAPAWAWGTRVQGSGQVVAVSRPVSGVHALELELPARVELVQGADEGLILHTDDNIAPLVDTVVEGGRLKVRAGASAGALSPTTLKLTLRLKTLDSVAISGSGQVHAQALQAQTLKVKLAGSGDMRVQNLNVQGELKLSIAGSGDFQAAGEVDELKASIAGSGTVDAPRLACRRVALSIAGSGDATVWARTMLKVNVAGSGDVRYWGDPEVSQSVAGSGRLKRLGAAPT